ncbi:protein lava lamp isoform X4 [Dermacentor silvarum]|uniref:protein lava lamp isoform X4 n=1 Tax=Dermacentor silvarum TaxID=543639 RepID=UPI0018985768|nr:protein lava lamp isoform X4 [Dermacentor silvarum]
MEEERLKKLRAGQEMFAEKRKRLHRRSAQQKASFSSPGSNSSGTSFSSPPSAAAAASAAGAVSGCLSPPSPASAASHGERRSHDNSDLLACTSPSSVPLPSSGSSSIGSRLSSDTSPSSMASAPSSESVSRKTSSGALSAKINNGLDSSFDISFSSIEACASPEIIKKQSEHSPAHGDMSFNEALSRYKRKMGDVKRQLSKRDELIRLLTERLEETRQEQERAQREASQQEHALAQEVSQLKRELQLCMELLEARGGDTGLRQQHQQMLNTRNEALEQLQQKVEAQEQQIAMLQQIRTDLLSRLAAAAASLGPEEGEIVTSNGSHPDYLASGECKAASPSVVGCRGDAVALTLMPLSELPRQHLQGDTTPEHLPSPEHTECDENHILSCKQVVCSHLSDWMAARSLSIDSHADIETIYNDLKLFAMQGLEYAAACEAYNIPMPNPADLLEEVATLHTKVTALEEDLKALEGEMIHARAENDNLRRDSVATEEKLKTLCKERNLALNSIKESEYQRAKEEVEDESLLEVYELQTECIRLEQEKKALEQQRTRLLSGDQSPCVSPIPSALMLPERVRHSSAVQTDDMEMAKSALESNGTALAQAVDKRLSLDSLSASIELDEGENEKGAYDALVAENIRLTAERQRVESDLEVVRERLCGAEELIEKLKAELEREHGSLEQLVAQTEEMLRATANTDLCSRDKHIFLENQSLKCQVVLLSSRLEQEKNFASALKRHVQCLGSRDESFQKIVKDLTNRLLSGGERLRSSLDRCRQLEQALAKSAAKAKRLEAELHQLRENLKASGDVSVDCVKHVSREHSALAEECRHHEEANIEASDTGSRKGSSGEGSVIDEVKPLAIQRMQLELEEKELLLSNQELCSRASQRLELCRQREELHVEYGERLSAVLAALKDSCRRELLSFQECLVRESSLQLLRLRETHQADIAALKQRHAEQVEQLRAKLLATETAQSSAAEEADAVLAELRQRQQAEYEQLLPRLDPDLQLKLQALVALTLRIHQVENERALSSAQEHLTSEKQRLWEALKACSQVQREALEAQLEHEQKAALREQYQALLNDMGQAQGTDSSVRPISPAAAGDSPEVLQLSHIIKGHLQSSTEVLFGLLKERIDKDFYTALNRLTDEWKAKYANTPGSAATEDSATTARDDAEALVHDLGKHLDSAKEAEQLVLSFHRLGEELRTGLHSQLEQLLGIYRELHSKMDTASALERYRGLCEQLCSGAPADPASLQHQQDLQLKALRASLEEQHSQEKTALLSEQVVRTKELLSKHREEVEQLEKTAEARLADERRRLTEELDVLRCSLWEKEQALSRAANEQQAKASAEMAELINKHSEEVQKLSSALEEEQKKTESLRSALDSLKKERDEIVELAESITRASSDSVVDPSTAIRRLAEENATLRREAEAAHTEYESMLSEEKNRLKDEVETVRAEYESALQNLEEKLRGAEVDHRRHLEELLASQEQYQEEVKLKDEELLLLKHEVEQYADTLGSQRLEFDQELENIERRLETKHAAEIESLKSEHRANIEVLRESLQRELLDVKAGYEEQQQKLRRSLETEHNLVANSQKAQFELALEALKKTHKTQMEKLKEQHTRAVEQLNKERAQLEQHMADERTSAIKDMKSKLEANYTEIVDTARMECAARVKQLQDELEKMEQQLSSLRQRNEEGRPVEEELVPATASQSAAEKPAKSVSVDSLDGKHPEEKDEGTAHEAIQPKLRAATAGTESSAREASAEWSDISVEDILYERSELLKQLKSLSATVDKLQAEKEDLHEQLRKANDELASKEIRATSRSPSKALLLRIPCRPFSEEKASPLYTCSGGVFCSREWLAGSGLTANEIQSWQLHTAQTNTRLLNVLSDLVKTYVDTEQEIQDALGHLGLSRVDSPASNTAADEDYSSLGGMSCQTQGSKEDFGDGFLSELCEDGPDLTPRTWDMFASAIGMQDTSEMEGEDVVLGASRRLRTAVDRVLRLLAEVSEHRGEDFRGLVQRNRDLCQELRQESQLHNQLALDLLHAQERGRALELEKQRLEDTVSQLEEQRTELQREVRSLRARAQRLEDARESLGEQRQLLEEQRRMLREGLHEPQIRLLEEHERLSEEKRRLERSQDQERDALAVRLAELEAALEEASTQREELLESRRLEVADLQAQIDAMDKQLLSHKKFIEEQTHEREQEREDFAQELAKLQEALKDKEKIQNCEQRLSKEIESLEQQLRMRVEDHGLVLRKRDQLEAEVRSRDDKIHDLRDIIRDLEADLSNKSHSVHELTLRVSNLEEALSVARQGEQEALHELEKARGGAQGNRSADMVKRVRQLEEQLEARTQELDKMVQMGSLLQEFRAQVRSLEEKVESRIRQVQDAHGSLRQLVQALSPVGGSREGALSGTSEDSSSLSAGGVQTLSVDDIRDGLSPSALQWDELRGLEEKVDALVATVGDTFQENAQLRKVLKATKKDKEELEREKRALQELNQQQLLQVSALKAHVEDTRLGLSPSCSQGGGPVGQQLRQLRKDLLREKEAREVAEHKLQLSTEQVTSLRGQLNQQRELVTKQRERHRPSQHAGTLTRDLEANRSPPTPHFAKLQKLTSTRGTMTQLSLQQLLELEAAQQRVRTLERTAELEAACSTKDEPVAETAEAVMLPTQKQDVANLQALLQERDEEIEALHQAVDAQVSPLREKLHSMEEELVSRERAWSEQRECLKQELARAREAHEISSRRLQLRLHEAQQLHANAQEALRSEVLALRDTLSRSVPKDEAAAALNKAVSAEREQQQSKHHEEIRLLEETWKERLEAERKRLEQEHAQHTADLERQCQLHARMRTWNRTDLEKEMASYLEQETAALDARHQNAVEALRQQCEQEKQQMRQGHADEMQRRLEKLCADLAREHSEQLAKLRETAEAEKAALLQECQNAEVQSSACNTCQQIANRDNSVPGSSGGKVAQLLTQEEIHSLVSRRITEEVTRLCRMHEAEVAELKKAVERQWGTEHRVGTSATEGSTAKEVSTSTETKDVQHLQQELQAEIAHLRAEMARMLQEKEEVLTARADQRLLSTKADFQRERDELSEALRRAQAEATQQDAAHREQLRRMEATLRAQLEAEKGRLALQQEQLVWRLREEHTQQLQALRTEQLREVEALREELDRAKLKLRAHKMAAMLRSRGSTPPSDNGSTASSLASAGTLDESNSQDSMVSPALRDLLGKIYREGLHVLSLTERQLLQRHLTPSPERSGNTTAASDHSTATVKAVAPATANDVQQLHEALKQECLAHKKALDELQEQMDLARDQHDQKELKLKAKVDTLEGQLRQERSRAEELKQRLDAEQAKTLELLTQLNSQRSSCLELEMALANCRSDLADANRQILALKQEVLHCKSSLEVEKLHAQNMLNAVNAERAHFNQLQATLELERRRGAMTREQDQQLIHELRAGPSSLPSTPARHTQLSEIEKMRGAPLSSTAHLDSSLFGEGDNTGNRGGGHYLCAREKLTLSQSLLKAEEEISRLRQLTLSQDLLLGQTAADGNPSPAICRLLHKLYWKYRKAESWRKGLIYQKQYLLSLLQGFQATEDVALRMLSGSRRRPPPSPPPLHHIDGIGTSSEDDGRPRQHGFRLHSADSSGGRHFQHLLAYQSRGHQDSVDDAPLPSGSSSHSSADGSSGIASSPPMPARFRFRSAVQAVVALHRMQHLVHKWRLAACVPPTPVLLHKVELAVRSVPHGGTWRLGASTSSGLSMVTARSSQSSLVSANTSQASAATVLCHRLPQPPSPRTPSRPSQSQPASMREFVERLDSLHKQFGLSDDQHC